MAILIIILMAIGAIFLGNPNNIAVIAEQKPFYNNISFWYAFSLLYPALTGIEVSMALSGSLKTPNKSILIGNLTSLFFVAGTYIALAVFAFYKIPFATLVSDPLAFTEYACSRNIVIFGIATAALSRYFRITGWSS